MNAPDRRQRPAVPIAAVLLLGLLGPTLRDSGLILFPILWNEDALILFPRFFANGGDAAGILAPHAGYVSLVPGLVGWMVAALPPTWAPHAYLAAALLGNALAVTPLLLRRAEPVLGPLPERAALAGLLALVPAGSIAIAASVMHLNWPMLLLACLLALLPLPAGRLSQVGTALLLALAIWTNPLALICLPILVLRSFWESEAREPAALVAAAALAFLVWGVDGTGAGSTFGRAPENLLAGVELVGSRAVLEAFLGSEIIAGLATTPVARALLAAAGWAVLAALAWFSIRGHGPARSFFVAGLVLLITGLTVGSVIVRDLGASYGLALRYFHTPKLLTLLLLGIVVADRVAGARWRATLALGLMTAWLAGLTALQIGWYRAETFTDPERGRRLQAFLKTVSEFPEDPRGLVAVFPDRRNIFDMVLLQGPATTAPQALPRPGSERGRLGWFVGPPDGGPGLVEEHPGAAADWKRAVAAPP